MTRGFPDTQLESQSFRLVEKWLIDTFWPNLIAAIIIIINPQSKQEELQL